MFWLILLGCVTTWGVVVPFQSVSGSLLLERDYFRQPPVDCRQCGAGNYANNTNCQELSTACPSFPPYAWPLPRISADCEIEHALDQLNCGVEPPFIKDSDINCETDMWKSGPRTQLYCQKKSLAESHASQIMTLPSLISLFAAPLFGYAVDHAGNRAVIAICTTLFILLAHVTIAMTQAAIWWILVVQGMSSCLYFAAIWPTIPCKLLLSLARLRMGC